MRILITTLLVSSLCAQTTGRRFIDPVFSQVRVTKDIAYSQNADFTQAPVTLKFDLYEPVGDTMARRPVVILIHAGSFLQPSIASAGFGRSPIGTREDSGIVALCVEFARRGYVAISATHRLGWNPQATTQEARAQGIIQAVWRAMQDGRALVRFLRKDAATTNLYRIDPDRIAMGGSSSGAYVGIHVAYLNRPEELDNPKFKTAQGNPFVDTTTADMGRGNGPNAFEGGGGHYGYSSAIQAVINLGGAIGDTSFIQNENIPVISLHGVQDPTTPYIDGVVVTAVGNLPIIEVFGSYKFTEELIARGNQTALFPDFSGDQPFPGLYPFYGAEFEPFGWYSNSTAAKKAQARTYVDTIVRFVGPRLFKVFGLPNLTMQLQPTVEVVSLEAAEPLGAFAIYPSPASEPWVTVSHPGLSLKHLELYTPAGQKVAEATPPPHTSTYLWSLPETLSQGLYLLRIHTEKGTFTQRWAYLRP